MGKVATEATLATGVEILKAIAKGQIQQYKSWEEIQQIVKSGMAADFFEIGDQIIVPWKDGTTEYQLPFDVVNFGNVELSDGTTTPGMYLESHYTTPFGVQFDANEAFYYCETALSPGTYYITAANSWGSNIVAGESYQFTTTVEVPSGGQIAFSQGTVDTAFASWRVYTYSSNSSTTALETITPVKGTNGTSLGSWSSSTKYGSSGVNNMQRSNYGYNRWSQSGIRQWLNSNKAAGLWWTAKNVYDRAPTEHASKAGFLAGFGTDFLGAIRPIKVTTALNTTSDSDIGTSENTYDLFFLASLEEEYCSPQLSGVEGSAWSYWKQILPSKHAQYATVPEHIRYGADNKTSAQFCRLRSALRSYANFTWSVYSSGNLTSQSATNSYRCAPACVIC